MHLIYKCDYCNCSFSGEEICRQHEEKCKPRMSVLEKRQFIRMTADKIFDRFLNETSTCLTDIVSHIRRVNTNDNDIQVSDWGFEGIFEMLVDIDSENIPKEIETEHIVDRCCYILTNHIKRINLD